MRTKSIINKDAPIVRSIRKTDLGTKARDVFTKKQINLRSRYNEYRYDAPIDPLQLYEVDPAEITQAMEPFDGPKRVIAGKVLGGTWDIETRPFQELDGKTHLNVYESFVDHFENGVPWEETPFYKALMREVQSGRGKWGCESEDDVKARCREMDRLYRMIKSEGYKSQGELAESSSSQYDNISRPDIWRIINNEIAVNVARSGEFVFYDGRHRLAIAKILELESIPVVILARHELWQRMRECVVCDDLDLTNLPTHIRSHPDVIGLL